MSACLKCGVDIAKPIEIARDGEIVATGSLCFQCFDRACEGATLLRHVFEEMIAFGISSEDANKILIEVVARSARDDAAKATTPA